MIPVPPEYTKGVSGYSVDPTRGILFGKFGRPLSGKDRYGYIRIWGFRGPLRGYAHRLIWQTVNGPIPSGMVINHINGIKTDNRIENLEMVTPLENHAHAVKTGLTNTCGEKNGNHVLTEDDVRSIRESTEPHRVLSLRFGVSKHHIWMIKNRKAWRSVA